MAFRGPLAYGGVAAPTPPNQVVLLREPTANDFQGFNIGDRWVVPFQAVGPSEQEWVLMSKAQNQAVWVQVNAGGAVTYTDHELLVGSGTSTINQIVNGTSGLPLLSQGASADPAYGVLAVPAGGTNKSTFVAYTPICGGTTTTGALQSVASLGASGTVLTSNGAGMLPTFQAPGGGTLTVPNGGTGDTSFLAYAVLTGGVTSVDPIQTVGSLGTSGQVLTSQGAGMLPHWVTNAAGAGFTTINVQTFTSNDTYTPTANMKYCIVEALGGGGGASGVAASSNGGAFGGGAGAGGYCRKVITAAAIGASKPVTIGAGGAGGVGNNPGSAGGNTTFGAILTANGAAGGAQTNVGSIGGTASGGDINIQGQYGASILQPSNPAIFALSGNGANSQYGVGGNAVGGSGGSMGASVAGNNGIGYGSGGSSALSCSGGVSTANGGAGGSGLVIVTEFIGT